MEQREKEMNNVKPVRTISLDLELTPTQQAKFAIEALRQDPELMPDCVIGGKTPPEMIEENKRKNEIRRQREFEIIAKFGVFDEYLAPIREEEAALSAKLAELRRDIADMEKLRPKT